jgi:hypothetical protein
MTRIRRIVKRSLPLERVEEGFAFGFRRVGLGGVVTQDEVAGYKAEKESGSDGDKVKHC